jgi:uncharacterized membrane protein YwzB
MNDIRKKVARVIMIVVTIATIYVLTQMGNPEYVPSIGWVGASFVEILAAYWAVQYAELPGFPRQYEKED